MVVVRNPKIDGGFATAELVVNSACCKNKIIKVIAFYDGKLFTDIANAETGSPIYVGLYSDLVDAWKTVL